MISLNFEIFLTHGCRFVILWSSWIVFIWNILCKCTTPSTNPNYVRGIIRLSAYHLSLLYPTQTLDIVVVFLWHFCRLCKIRLWENSPKPDSLKIYFLRKHHLQKETEESIWNIFKIFCRTAPLGTFPWASLYFGFLSSKK